MKYFSQNFINFFEQLEKNNHKEWFDANRKIYETEVKNPFKNLVANLIQEISIFDNSIEKDPQKAIFRINRDIRFSKDKTPYKTHVSAAFVKGGRKGEYPGYYLEIGHEKMHLGGGLYMLDKTQLNAIRDAIAANPEDFTKIIADKNFKTTFGTVLGEKNKRLSPEHQNIAKTIPLIANKQFYYMAEFKSADFILKDNLVETIIEKFKAGYQLNQFLAETIS